ncbi:30S ribosome-binding factor RbfA [Aestuariibius sp. HNIBRBA575]|uniref:30S ribosome-binding factor RbfA n=1 Tax=Aestuariibius sp. HNIBRBA575 TaxID=3233343 RepID=UPI0034A3A398
MSKKRFSEGRGPSQRMLRVGEVIRRTLSEILQRGEIHDPDLGRMLITVGEVRVTPDLGIATAFVLPLGGKNAEEAIEVLARNKGELRRMIGRKAQLKHAPELRFRIDDTFDQIERTAALFDNDHIQQDLRTPTDDRETDEDDTV